MGYETHFRLHGELDKKFVPMFRDFKQADVEKNKHLLIASCMLPVGELKDTWDLSKLYDRISVSLKLYVAILSEEWKTGLKSRFDEDKKEVYFCGWENSDREGNHRWTEEEIYDYFTKELFMLSIHNVQSPFNKDEEINEQYYKKLEAVSDIIEDISESVYDMWDGLFIQRYRNSEDADESDGYSHKYPEEEE